MISTGDTFLARYCASSSVADKKPISPVIATSSGSHHHIVQIFAADEAIEIGGEVTPAPVGRTLGKPRAMRRHQHVRQFVKRKARRAVVGMLRAPMLPPHIERGAADPVAAQRVIKRLFF